MAAGKPATACPKCCWLLLGPVFQQPVINSVVKSRAVKAILLKNFKTSYSGEFKQSVVEYMHTNHLSSFETAIHFNLAGDYVVSKWERIYYEEGPQGLYIERRGRSKNMSSKPKKKNLNN